MKDIKIIIAILFLLLFIGACTENSNEQEEYNFVRFGLLVNPNGQIIEYPNAKQNIPETDTYNHVTIRTIKIPVVLTSKLKNTPTDVFYEINTEGNFNEFVASPQNKITIPAGKLVDTLRITFKNNWKEANANKIKIKIIGTSDPSITIGWPNSVKKMNMLTINLGDLEKTRYFFNQNIYSLAGVENEELLIPILFSQPVTNAIIGNFNFIKPTFEVLSACDGLGSSFKYSLERMPFTDGVSQIFYKFKLLETTPFASNLKLNLNIGLNNFILFGANQTSLLKPLNVNRQGDVAVNFYNSADLFYRTFGKAWYFNTSTNLCDWSDFNTFTKPVPVPLDSEFDNGKGFHKYRIGFVANNAPIGTNPFDLRRFYAGANVSSPGYTVMQALDFFPDNGTSTSKGIVKIVPQVLSFIKTSNGATINIPICGSGNYFYESVKNRWVIYLELHCDETLLNGNSDVIKPMYIYSNNNGYADPDALSLPCPKRSNL